MERNQKKKAVLLMNIGSPESTRTEDVKTYLNRFLMDSYVITIPTFFRWLLMKKIVVPKRAPKSAEAYKKIWTKEGSPLVALTKKLVENLNLTDSEYEWFYAMRYSAPEVIDVLSEIKNKGYKEFILFPAYPQYATSSTESNIEYVKEKLNIMGWKPKVSVVKDFYNNTDFIDNIVMELPKDLELDKFDHVLFSFHGLPESHLTALHPSCQEDGCFSEINDKNKKCYRAQCYQTARAVAEKLNLNKETWSMSFQSRLGPQKWIEPYTDKVALEFAQKGHVKSLLVFSLSFVTDCLETLEELDIQLKDSFLNNGGEHFVRIPCLNDKFYSAQKIIKNIDYSL